MRSPRSYSLSKAARVLFRIERAARGRKGRTRYVKVGAFAQAGNAGANRKKWSGKLGRHALRPGRYRATLIASTPGVAATGPCRLSFTIVRG